MTRSGFFSVDSLRGVWVLVVDPDPHGRQTLVEILSYCGALVTPLASPAEALNVMRQVKPDVLVVTLAQSGDLAFIRLVRALKPEEGGVVPGHRGGLRRQPVRRHGARPRLSGLPAQAAGSLGAVSDRVGARHDAVKLSHCCEARSLKGALVKLARPGIWESAPSAGVLFQAA